MPPAKQFNDGLDVDRLHFADVGGIRTRYYEAGSGEPLLLIHGGNFGSLYSLDAWSLNLAGLSPDFHVYAFDKLGQGYTDNPKSRADYTFDALYHHTRQVVDTFNIRGATIIGHSRGAILAARLTLDVPGLAKRLVILDSNTLAPEDTSLSYRNFYSDIARRTPPGQATRETVRMEPDENSFSSEHVTDNFIDRLLQTALLPKVVQARDCLAEIGQETFFPYLEHKRDETLLEVDSHGFPVPTLVVWGFNDVSAPLSLGLALFGRICPKTPDAYLHVFNRAGHYAFREHPAEFNALLRHFCAG